MNVPSQSGLKLPSIPGLQAARDAAANVQKAAEGAAKNAANLGNGLADGAHKQLINFGAQTNKNIAKGTEGAHAGWMSVHKNIDNGFLETGNNMQR